MASGFSAVVAIFAAISLLRQPRRLLVVRNGVVRPDTAGTTRAAGTGAAAQERERRPLPELEPLHSGIDGLLTSVETTVRQHPEQSSSSERLPDLRERYIEVQRALRAHEQAAELLSELDEMVDAANGLAAAAGLEAVDIDQAPEEEPARQRSAPAWFARIRS